MPAGSRKKQPEPTRTQVKALHRASNAIAKENICRWTDSAGIVLAGFRDRLKDTPAYPGQDPGVLYVTFRRDLIEEMLITIDRLMVAKPRK